LPSICCRIVTSTRKIGERAIRVVSRTLRVAFLFARALCRDGYPEKMVRRIDAQ